MAVDADRVVGAYQARRETLRLRLLPAIAALWERFGGPTDEQSEEFRSRAIPLILAAQGATITGTDAYLALLLKEAVVGLNPDEHSGGAVRNGTDPAVVYHRPIVTLRAGLAAGKAYADANRAAAARLEASVDTDLQLAHRSAARDVFRARRVARFARRTTGASCELCRKASGEKYYRENLLPIHGHCDCTVVPLERGDAPISLEPEPVKLAVHDHGELGPMLGNAAHAFTGPSDL